MQAIEKTIDSNNWITIILVALLICIFLLKAINSNKLKATVFTLFNKSYVEDEVENRASFFNSFNLILYIFLNTILSLLLYIFIVNSSINAKSGFILFSKIFLLTSIYFISKWFLEYLISILLEIRGETKFFLISKTTYLFSLSFAFFIAIILFFYTGLKVQFLAYFVIIFFLIRIVFHLINNKKLILSKLFYFILYFCAFEIAPLFVLFKLML